MLTKNVVTKHAFGVIRTSAQFIVFALAACQQTTPIATSAASAIPAEKWKLSVSPGETGTYLIHVANSDGKEVQVLDGPEGDPPYDAASLLKLEDLTGDGNPDILARGLSAGASALASESIYVYDAKSGRFLDAELFKNDGEVTKTGAGCIAVEHRNPDNMTYSSDQYCWQGHWVFKGGK